MSGPGRPELERIEGLYAIVDTDLLPAGDVEGVADGLMGVGVGVLQLRAKSLPSGDFLRLARRLSAMAKRQGVLFIVNDRVDVALGAGAAGVHLGQDDIPVDEARRLLREERIIGFSTHSLEQARGALGTSADYISFGPVFSTTTKKKADPALGIEALAEARGIVGRKLVAIGGITEERLGAVLETGVDAVAMISDVILDADPSEKARRIMGVISRGA
jgi:thiamine-phosphate pyrophosphorylase